MNKNQIITDDFSCKESKRLYQTEYTGDEASKIAHELKEIQEIKEFLQN